MKENLNKEEFINVVETAYTGYGIKALMGTYCVSNSTTTGLAYEKSDVMEDLTTRQCETFTGFLADGTKVTYHEGFIADSYAREYFQQLLVDDTFVWSKTGTSSLFALSKDAPYLHLKNEFLEDESICCA